MGQDYTVAVVPHYSSVAIHWYLYTSTYNSTLVAIIVAILFFFLDVAMVWKGKPASVTTGTRDRTYVRK